MIKFHKSQVNEKMKDYLLDVIESGNFNDQEKYYSLCKNFLINFTGAKNIILTHSATAALELAFQILIDPKDKVLMPSFTFSSTANAPLKFGGEIFWGEISLDNLCLDLENDKNLNLINNSNLVAPVHYGNTAVDMNKLVELSKISNFKIIEDAAQSLGVFIKNKHVGTFGTFGVLSFHNTKHIHAGFGGALIINDEKYYDLAMEIYNRGTNRHLFQKGLVNKYNWTQLGSSHGNSEINYAILYSQLEDISRITKTRKFIYDFYFENFKNLAKVKLQNIDLTKRTNYSSFYLLVEDRFTRDNLIQYLNKQNIQSQFHYIPLHSSPMGKKYSKSTTLHLTDLASDTIIRLPIYPTLKIDEQELIVESVKKYFKE